MACHGSYFITTLHRREPTGKYDRKRTRKRKENKTKNY